MKFSISLKWLQDTILVMFVVALLGGGWYFRDVIESFTRADWFFYLVLAAVVLFAILIFLLSLIKTRVDALANARTADLLETQKLFVELYRNSPIPYVMIDDRGQVTYPNHAALKLFGLQDDGFGDVNVFDLLQAPDDSVNSQLTTIQTLFSQGVFVGDKDVMIERSDGTQRYGLLSIFPYGHTLFKRQGLMTIVDITKQKEIEKAKSEFVSLASLQLRTPVSSMKWNLELMQSPQFGKLTEGQLEYLHKASKALVKMNTIIEDFLNVSQLELGTKTMHVEEVELVDLFKDVAEEFTGRVAQKNLTLENIGDERVRGIETDKRLLHMVVSNLVSNATKYTPEDGQVRMQFTGSDDVVTITVEDSGVGIPMADQENLFTKFYRASNVREQIQEGTGLGLYIVKLAVEKMGGKISVASEENKGTTFTVILPISSSHRVV